MKVENEKKRARRKEEHEDFRPECGYAVEAGGRMRNIQYYAGPGRSKLENFELEATTAVACNCTLIIGEE